MSVGFIGFKKFNFEKTTVMALASSNTRDEIKNLIGDIQSEKELQEIKSLLIAYFSDKVVISADAAYDEKCYTTAVFDKWKEEHFRKKP